TATVNGVASNALDLSSINGIFSQNTYTDNHANNGNYSINDLNIGTKNFISLTGTAFNQQFTITGITGGVAGKTIIIYNSGSGNMIVNNLNSASAAANQISTLNGGNINTNQAGNMTFVYDGVSSKWIVTGIQQ
ncbi:MAG: hypothetical protein ABIS01_07030, partial [Ferruginibacter sp.]